jgi:signal transduction histidine kinase
MKKQQDELKRLISFSDELAWSGQVDSFCIQSLSTVENITNADAAAVYLVDPQQECLRLLAQEKDMCLLKGFESLPTSMYLRFDWLTKNLRTITIDYRNPSVEDFLPDIFLDYYKCGVVIPLAVGKLLQGTLCLAFKGQISWADRHLDFFDNIGRIFGRAIYHAQSHQRAQEFAALHERTLISRELHDGFSQDVSALGMQVDSALLSQADRNYELLNSDLAQIRDSVKVITKAIREELLDLSSSPVEKGSLTAQIRRMLERFEDYWHVSFEFDDRVDGEVILSDFSRVQLLRVTREALNNVRMHSNATRVLVEMSVDYNILLLHVHDNGIGFDPLSITTTHFGLRIMKERTNQINGTFEVASVPQAGTDVLIRIPILGLEARS